MNCNNLFSVTTLRTQINKAADLLSLYIDPELQEWQSADDEEGVGKTQPGEFYPVYLDELSMWSDRVLGSNRVSEIILIANPKDALVEVVAHLSKAAMLSVRGYVREMEIERKQLVFIHALKAAKLISAIAQQNL